LKEIGQGEVGINPLFCVRGDYYVGGKLGRESGMMVSEV